MVALVVDPHVNDESALSITAAPLEAEAAGRRPLLPRPPAPAFVVARAVAAAAQQQKAVLLYRCFFGLGEAAAEAAAAFAGF